MYQLNRWASAFFIGLFCICIFGAQATGQEIKSSLSPEDKGNLTEVLRIPAKTQIETKTVSLRPSRSYTIYVGTRFDFEVEDPIKAWIERWNEKQARKFGRLILTDDLQEADIVLVQYLDFMTEISETIYHPIIATHNGIRVPHREDTKYSPMHAYLIVPQAEGFAILWHHQRLARYEIMAREKKDSGRKLTNTLARLLKKQRL